MRRHSAHSPRLCGWSQMSADYRFAGQNSALSNPPEVNTSWPCLQTKHLCDFVERLGLCAWKENRKSIGESTGIRPVSSSLTGVTQPRSLVLKCLFPGQNSDLCRSDCKFAGAKSWLKWVWFSAVFWSGEFPSPAQSLSLLGPLLSAEGSRRQPHATSMTLDFWHPCSDSKCVLWGQEVLAPCTGGSWWFYCLSESAVLVFFSPDLGENLLLEHQQFFHHLTGPLIIWMPSVSALFSRRGRPETHFETLFALS